jgi:hypothetical protein
LNYWDLIKDAFWITLRNRYLWFFGFFAGVGARLTSISTSQGAAEASITTTSTGAALRPSSSDSSRLTIRFPVWESLLS